MMEGGDLDPGDRVEIQQLLAYYAHAVDSGDLALLERLFTEDGVFDCSAAGGRPYVGLADIKSLFALGKPPHPPSHHTTNVYVYRDGSTVRVLAKYFVLNGQTGTGISGEYRDVVVRREEGWRFRERIVTQTYP
jgi:hypothetical protein